MFRRLSLDLREAELEIDCVTHQGIPLGVKGVVTFKVGDDFHSIANSARRFLDQQDQMEHRVHNVFAGHLRAIVGNMTVEETDPRPREAHRPDPGVLGRGDGEAGPDRGLTPDPRDRRPHRLRREPGPAAGGRSRVPRPHRLGRGRPGCHRSRGPSRGPQGGGGPRLVDQAVGIRGRGRPGRGGRPTGRTPGRGPGPPTGGGRGDQGRATRGRAGRAAAPRRGAQAGRRQGL